LAELYRSRLENRPARLKEIAIQYADYAIWQRNYLQGELLDDKLNYWRRQLTGVSPLDLPADHARPAVQSTEGRAVNKILDKSLREALSQLARQEYATLFMTLLTAFQVLLYRYTGEKDICVGSPVAGRGRQELEGLIGSFVNTIVLRSDWSGNPGFRELLRQVRQMTL